MQLLSIGTNLWTRWSGAPSGDTGALFGSRYLSRASPLPTCACVHSLRPQHDVHAITGTHG